VRRNTAHAFWREQDGFIQKFLGNDSASYPFMQRLYRVLETPPDTFAAFVRSQQVRFEESLLETRRNPLSRAVIPALTHRIWLTSPEHPCQPPADFLAGYCSAIRGLPAEAVHFFWTNSAAVAEAVRQQAAASGCPNVCLMDPAMLGATPIMARIGRLIEASKFVLAADALKIVVLERFGGIYSDLGIVYDRQVFELVLLADYAFIVSNALFFQTSFFACPPAADLARLFLAVMNVPGALDPSYALSGPAATALDEVHMFAGLALTACAMLFMPPAARALMVPAQTPHLVWASHASWYGSEPKFGNVLISQTPPTLIDSAEFRAADELFAVSARFYGHNPLLHAQLRVLVPLHSYFADHATPMCQNFLFHGSDKALGWHNYGYVYNFLLGRMNGRIKNILEIGIGTNNLDMPSTMGATGVPGASLRAWRENFSLAQIVGADVDDRILFQEGAIETFWVDQTHPEAIAQLFANIGPRRFDLIVDDGLHTFEANRTLMDGAYRHLVADGLYIIEDVADHTIEAWDRYLVDSGLEGVLLHLPHPTNHSDNRLILIPGGQAA
jgi:hypothetical protein